MASGLRSGRRAIIVTGAYGELGRAVAQAATEGGLQVAALDLNVDFEADIAQEWFPIEVDLTDALQTAEAVNAVVAKFGRLDVLVNVAGGFTWQTISDAREETWSAFYRLNVLTALNASRAALPHLQHSPSGRIVNVGAASALKPGLGMGPYGASKAGLHALTLALADEVRSSTLTVNAVLPSILDTPRNRADLPEADFTTWVLPRDVASVIGFLISEAACAVTGALLPVTGRTG